MSKDEQREMLYATCKYKDHDAVMAYRDGIDIALASLPRMTEEELVMAPRFDIELFACELDSKRFSNRMTWVDVAKAAGVSKSTMSRVCWRKQCDVDSLTRILSWLGQPFEKFVTQTPEVDHEPR